LGVDFPLNPIAMSERMIYHAVTHVHNGLESRASGRIAQAENFPQIGLPGVGELRAGEV
jgi:hypothetical protein